MLQRIQTVYLLIIVALTVATLFLPLAVLQQGDALFSFDASVSVKIALSFPLVNLILDYLAIRNIGADEALVRSLDRLR